MPTPAEMVAVVLVLCALALPLLLRLIATLGDWLSKRYPWIEESDRNGW